MMDCPACSKATDVGIASEIEAFELLDIRR